jgi:hypothetical protein
MPVFVACAFLPDELFLTWKHAQNFTSSSSFAAGLSALAIFSLAAWIGFTLPAARYRSYGVSSRHLISSPRYRALVYGILSVCLAAYALLLGPIIQDPALVWSFLNESLDTSAADELLARAPGITSLVNLGPLYVTLLLLQPTLTGMQLSRFDRILLAAFLLTVTARVFLGHERLALVETLIPIAIIRLALIRPYRILVAMLPLIAMLGLPFFFGVTEYFRSWTHFYSKMGLSLTDFVLSRLFGYYATSINNGAVIFTMFDPSFRPYHVAEWFYRFPWLSDDSGESFLRQRDVALSSFTNPEFTNTSGLFGPMHDLGLIAGLAVWAVLGAAAGLLCRGFKDRRLLPLLLYPSWMTGVYELLRIFYWGGPRYFPILASVPFVYWFLASSAVKRPTYVLRRMVHRAEV